MNHDPLLRWFGWRHLPTHLQSASQPFQAVAERLCETLRPSAERTVALRKLLEGKDAAVRAALLDHEQDQQSNHIEPKEK